MTLHEATWTQARDSAHRLGHRLDSELVPIAQVDRRVSAAPINALTDLPGFTASAMDGWAVRGPEPWTIVGSVNAGDATPAPLESGTCVRIATGGPVPLGADGIVRIEHASIVGGCVVGPARAEDVRLAGEECRKGDLLADRGTTFSPALIGLVAAAGHDVVAVTSKPRVNLLVLGDELDRTGVPRAGRVRDALGPQVPAWLHRAGAEVTTLSNVPDLLDSLCAELARATADVVITTGGTAAGPRDHLRAALTKVGGQVVVDEVMVRPGHPMLLATIGGRPLVALPGNPQAAVVALLTLALPLIDAMLGRPTAPPEHTRIVDPVGGLEDRERLVPGRITEAGFESAAHSGPAMMRGLASSSGYALIPIGGAAAGDRVTWLALP